MDRYAEGKKLFDKYDGSKFHMQREGDLEKYKSCNIPPEVERKWEEQYISEKIQKLKTASNNSEKLELIEGYIDGIIRFKHEKEKAVEYIEYILNSTIDFDTYTQIRLIEIILNQIEVLPLYKQKYYINYSIMILRQLLEKDITVDDSYYKKIKLQEYLEENVLRERINNSLKFLRKKKKYNIFTRIFRRIFWIF